MSAEPSAEKAHTRATTIRLPVPLSEAVDAVARADDMSASEVIRTAVSEYVERRGADREFRARLAALIARDQAILEALR